MKWYFLIFYHISWEGWGEDMDFFILSFFPFQYKIDLLPSSTGEEKNVKRI